MSGSQEVSNGDTNVQSCITDPRNNQKSSSCLEQLIKNLWSYMVDPGFKHSCRCYVSTPWPSLSSLPPSSRPPPRSPPRDTDPWERELRSTPDPPALPHLATAPVTCIIVYIRISNSVILYMMNKWSDKHGTSDLQCMTAWSCTHCGLTKLYGASWGCM